MGDPCPLRVLHDKLLEGDAIAAQELSCHLLPLLTEEMARRFPGTDEHHVWSGVIDAVWDYVSEPGRFDPGKSTLERFLSVTAWRNIDNALVGERRRARREREAGGKNREANVALDPAARNIEREEQELTDRRRADFLAALSDPVDREVLSLRLRGVRDTEEFARVLGLTHLPDREKRAAVKRRKDRIARYLRRKGLTP